MTLWLDELRVANYAVWTADFTPPVTAYGAPAGITRTPAAAALALGPAAPASALWIALQPAAAAVALSGALPGQIIRINLSPAAAGLALAPQPPAARQQLTPAVAGLALSATIPALLTNYVPATVSIALSTAAPAAQQQLTPAVAGLALSATIPVAQVQAGAVTLRDGTVVTLRDGTVVTIAQVQVPALSPAAASLALASSTPVIQVPAVQVPLTPAAASLAVSTVAPNYFVGAAVPASVLLLLHFDGANASTSFPDASGRGHIVTPSGAAQVETSQLVFAGGGGLFPGSSDNVSLDGSSDFSFGFGDFTVDQWVRFDALANYTVADWAPGPQIRIKSDGHAVYAIGGTDRITSAAALSINTSYHVAVTRSSGTTRLFINGVPEASTYVASDFIAAGTNRPIFGGRQSAGRVLEESGSFSLREDGSFELRE